MSSIEIRFNGGKESQTIYIPGSTGKKRIHLVFTKAQKEPLPGDKVSENVETIIVGDRIWYNCKECDKKFSKEVNCRNHVRLRHLRTKNLLCSICGKAYLQKSQYDRHMANHRRRPFQCTICRRRFDSDEKLKIHFAGQHEGRDRRFQCGNCNKLYLTLQQLKQHVVTHSDVKPYNCDICLKSFFYPESLRNHMATHNKIPSQCPVCSREFKLESSMKKHIQAKHPDYYSTDITQTEAPKSTDEPTCSRENGSDVAVVENSEISCTDNIEGETVIQDGIIPKTEVEDDAVLECDDTGTIVKINEWKDGKTDDEKPEVLFRERQTEFICNICGKVLKRKDNLHEHLKVHSGEKPFACTVCNKSFRQKAHLQRHVKTHTGERTHVCQYCGKAFGRKEHLSKHITTHLPPDQKVLNYCDFCGKSVINLKKHLKTHKGIICEECGAVFSDERIFQAHVIDGIHYKENELSKICPICFQKFAKSANVRRHMANVHGQGSETVRHFKCSVCGKKFSNERNFQNHVVQGHGLMGHIKKTGKAKSKSKTKSARAEESDESNDEDVKYDDESDEDVEDDGFDVLDMV